MKPVNYQDITQHDWARFWAKVSIPDEGNALYSRCWDWKAKEVRAGYGRFRVKGNKTGSHNLAYAFFYGDYPDNMCVLHKCDNKLCCNPDHLFLGTLEDNNRDRSLKGRSSKGEKHWKAKLTEAQAIAALELCRAGMSMAKVGARFGVSRSAIQSLVEGRSWKHLHKLQEDTSKNHLRCT